MNVQKYWSGVLAALGDSSGAKNLDEFQRKHIAALEALALSDAEIETVIAAKTEIAALDSESTAAEIVAALQA
jgi:predicted extracellular nuclease